MAANLQEKPDDKKTRGRSVAAETPEIHKCDTTRQMTVKQAEPPLRFGSGHGTNE